ncbi:glycosyltransferase family 4 protein [Methylobacter sp. YRD-M1]|uniref:glycosyltransferase family 4 protein n=1 Tax=Methylobacter sp. YRD-M1 TaxID=2911520 RepID=UPI00227B177D|nr:glycosyltransferase family 4 protein [Methylobacter sp. YRD-M1]WAK01476.1 glycosyltransferase family 4 protein [Methylobacter sp. YRD-M1]
MKILMVTRETQADRRYGLGRSLAPLVDEFQRRNIVVDYACQDDLGVRAMAWQRKLQRLLSGLFSPFNTDTDFPILIHVILERLNMGRLAARIAARHEHTHVHCHDPIIAAGFSFFSRFHPRLNARWGVTEHGFGCYTDAIHADGVRMGSRMLNWLRRWEARTLSAASWVVSPTRSALEQVAVGLKVAPVPTTWRHIYHARPMLNHYSREEARRRLGWQDDVLYILGIGRIAPVKQFPMLIEACARLKKQTDIQLMILGAGEHDSLQAMGKQQGLARDILFGSTDDVGLFLCAADLYVSTSASESFGLANLEAMAAGLAVLCTAVGGVPEVVGDGAQLVAPEPEALAGAMQQLLDDPELRQAIAQKGLRRAEAWPDIAEIADNYEKIYQ